MNYLQKLKNKKIYNSQDLIDKIVEDKSRYEINALINEHLYTSRTLQFTRKYKNGKITFWLDDFTGESYSITKVEFLNMFQNYEWIIDHMP